MNINTCKIWFLAARPKTLPAGIAPVLIGTAMAIEDRVFHAPSAVGALLGAILIQIGTNYANDYFDFVKGTDNSDRLGPARATQQGWVTPRQMMVAAILVFALAFGIGLYLIYRGGVPILIIGLLSILCGVLYTGGPYPLGYLGLGEVFVLIFFGPVAVAGTYYVQAQQMYWAPIVAGLAPGLFSVAILTVNNLRDIEGDRLSGKKTLAVRFGVSFARYEYLLSIILASILVPWWLAAGTGGHCAVLLASFVPLAGIPPIIGVFKRSGPFLNQVLASTGKLLLLYTLLFSIGWVL
ncbi:MAG TPA: 1,4-dihydroxy-2-naphthoate polyprenyltransferase [Candidatus Hydrogenedentes bacterium]|nr:1,4-dihydroxy-2-naphthoate polyprenyltransferase [Candidatus Hydrogenedentota bacterium]